MVNQSKLRNPRAWSTWRASGAVSSVGIRPEGYISPDGVLSVPRDDLPMSELEAYAEECDVSAETIALRALGQYIMIRTEEQHFRRVHGCDRVRTRVIIELREDYQPEHTGMLY